MTHLNTAYAKTAAGLEEIQSRARQLNRQQRQLLILVDGRGVLGALAESMACTAAELRELAAGLARQGLIAPVVGKAGAEVNTGATREALVGLAEQIFGSRAGPLVLRLAKAPGDDSHQLLEAAIAAARLAKLAIDEEKAAKFLVEARRLLGA